MNTATLATETHPSTQDEAIARITERGVFESAGIPDMLNELIAAGVRVDVVYTTGHWLDVNDIDDLRAAGEFAYGGSQ